MPTKAEKDKFSRDEIIEILKRNVSLYKDEKEFVEYIVNLAVYLMDQKFEREKQEEEDSLADLDDPIPSPSMGLPAGGPHPAGQPRPHLPPGLVPSNRPPGAPLRQGPRPMAPPHPPQLAPPVPPGAPRPAPAPPAMGPPSGPPSGEIDPMEEFLQKAPPRPFGSAPPPAGEPAAARPRHEDHDLYGFPSPQMPQPTPAKPAPPAGEARPPRRDVQVQASPLRTPSPETKAREDAKRKERPAQPQASLEDQPAEGERGERNFDVIDRGRTRVYRVVRPFRSSTSFEVPCPVCGASVPAESKRCSSCGHLM